MEKITRQLANEIKIAESQVRAAVELLDGGATVEKLYSSANLGLGNLDFIGELAGDFFHSSNCFLAKPESVAQLKK